MPYFLRELILDFGGNLVSIPVGILKKLVSAGRQARENRIFGCWNEVWRREWDSITADFSRYA
jgi:hypothetical protein